MHCVQITLLHGGCTCIPGGRLQAHPQLELEHDGEFGFQGMSLSQVLRSKPLRFYASFPPSTPLPTTICRANPTGFLTPPLHPGLGDLLDIAPW
jgi:hypothetical protein